LATKHELEIEISAGGKVEVRVKGAKGKRCLEYVQLFNAIGKVEDQQLTASIMSPSPESSSPTRLRLTTSIR